LPTHFLWNLLGNLAISYQTPKYRETSSAEIVVNSAVEACARFSTIGSDAIVLSE
jgi:hypothetical protein